MTGPPATALSRATLLRLIRPLLLALPLAVASAAGPASAQATGGIDLGKSDQPIEIEASEGIEWHRDQKVYIARGDTRISRGDLTVFADLVTAHYREQGKSGSDIWRVEAEGHVRVKTPTETVSGDRAVYDLDKGVVVMYGRDLRAVSAEETLTAKESLEYWERRQMVVARGDAVVLQGDKRLRADVLTGHFEETADGKQKLARVDAIGDVQLSTASEFARGEKGTYDLETEVATLEGSVKITRGENQLNGEFAEVNMKTGISRLLGSPTGEGGTRVRSLIIPSSKPAANAQ